MKSGFVSIVGHPNVGKSTLLNNLLDMHLAITSDKAGTTRNVIQGVYEDIYSQIVFVDTPGIHKPNDKLSTILNRKAYNSTDNVDLILFLIDASTGFKDVDSKILDRIKELDLPIILVLNKVDKVNKEKLLADMMEYSKLYDFEEIFPISALKDNLKDLIKSIKKHMPNEGKIFEDETYTNISTDFYISEIIREKVLRKTHDEVPHSVTCVVEEKEFKKDKVVISAVIVVDNLQHKKIIVGSKASMLKSIGHDARIDLEEYFNKKVYLSLFVKVIEDWKDKDKYLKELGLDDLEN